MRTRYGVLFSLLLLTNLLPAFGAVPGTSVDDRLLSRLRGIWEYRTYSDVKRIEFVSDNQLWVDRQLSQYTISPSELTVVQNNTTVNYPCHLTDETLEIRYPDSTVMKYENDGPGELEERLDGRFFAWRDSVNEDFISFKNGREFIVSTRFDSTTSNNDRASMKGLYRIDDDRVVLSFDDGTTDEAIIRFRDERDEPDEILYHGYLFDKKRKLIVTLPYYPRPIIPYYPPPEPPFPSCPGPGPNPPPNPPPPSGGTNSPSPGNDHQNGDRTIGSHRGSVDDSQSSDNRTEGNRRGGVRP